MQIVVLDGGTLHPGDISWDPIARLGDLHVFDRSSPAEALQRSREAGVLVVNKVLVDRELLTAAPLVGHIAVTATGYNNIDLAVCRERGISVSNVSDYGSATVAQHVFALLLALTNRPERHARRVAEGAWSGSGAFSFWDAPMVELDGKTLGIIGMGHIGERVARIGQGFGMDVLYYSASGRTRSTGMAVALDELIRTADVISLNTLLHQGNAGLVDRAFLDRMKSSAFLINTSRGGLIDEDALCEALQQSRIAGAGLDVLRREPAPADHPLVNLPNCVVTPHNAWASVEARQRMMEKVAENIAAFLAGKPIHRVD